MSDSSSYLSKKKNGALKYFGNCSLTHVHVYNSFVVVFKSGCRIVDQNWNEMSIFRLCRNRLSYFFSLVSFALTANLHCSSIQVHNGEAFCYSK